MVKMRTLDRMLVSDLLRIWRQGLAISLLLACGITLFVMTTSAMRSLQSSQDRYYSNYRFADIFASLTRAPQYLTARIQNIPGASTSRHVWCTEFCSTFPEWWNQLPAGSYRLRPRSDRRSESDFLALRSRPVA